MIQLVVVNLYTKFEVSIFNGCGDTFAKIWRERKETNKRKNKKQRPIFNPTIQLVVVNLYTTYKISIFNGCGDIFDEKFGKKEKEQTKGRTNKRMPICNSTIQLVVVDMYTKYEVSISLTKNLERKKKRDKHKEEQIGECPFAIPRYNLLLWTCIPNMKFLSKTVVEISLTKKCYGITEGRTEVRTEGRTDVNQYTPHFFKAGV